MITCTKRLRCKYNTLTPIWSGRMAQDTKDGRKKRSDLWDPTLVVLFHFLVMHQLMSVPDTQTKFSA